MLAREVALEGTERRCVLSVGGRGPSFRTDLLAVEGRMTLGGFLGPERFNVYAGTQRLAL